MKALVEVERGIRCLHENNPFVIFSYGDLKELRVLKEKKISLLAIEEVAWYLKT